MGRARKNPKPEVFERERQVIELRAAGRSFNDIAQVVGFKNASGAFTAYERALKRTMREAGLEECRSLELERLDKLQSAAWPDAMLGDMKAIDSVLKIMDRRSKYLGLDAPIKVEASVDSVDAGSIDSEIFRLMGMLSGNVVGRVPSRELVAIEMPDSAVVEGDYPAGVGVGAIVDDEDGDSVA